jgi:hypothetical protein
MTTLSKRELARLESVILVATTNPKKPGSMSHERFQHYFEVAKQGTFTIKDALNAGLRMDDIRHDEAHGFIILGDDAIAAHEAAKPREMCEADILGPVEAPKKKGKK